MILKAKEKQERIILANLPMPPTSNKQYFAISRGRKAYLTKTKELKNYQDIAFPEWEIKNLNAIGIAKKKVEEWTLGGQMIRVDLFVCYRYSDIWTKDGRPKANDYRNRFKAIDDCLAKSLGIDDRIFWSGYCEKLTTQKDTPFCMVIISAYTPRVFEDLKLDDLV